MIEFIGQDQNFPFLVATMIVLGLAALEGVLTLAGFGISHLLDNLLPSDIGVPEVDFDLDLDASSITSGGLVTGLLAWLKLGKVPMIISLIIFLLAFGLIGFVFQGLIQSIFGFLLPKYIAVIPVFLCAVPVMATGNSLISMVMPREETSAVSVDTFIGRVAIITIGTAQTGSPAQAKLEDEFEQTHYVMVEPDVGVGDISTGEQILITERKGAFFIGIRPSDLLSN